MMKKNSAILLILLILLIVSLSFVFTWILFPKQPPEANIYNEGLHYKLSDGEKSYVLCGIESNSVIDYSIVVPSEVNGLPVKEIGSKAFLQNDFIVSIEIPDSVTVIGEGAFYECERLQTVILPDSITRIEKYAFCCCYNLKTVSLSNGLKSIGEAAFYNCTQLENITLPDSLTRIEKYAFYNCTELKNITLPDSITSIEEYAFQNCTKLKNITLPDSLTSIGKAAFLRCGLTSISIPGSVSVIGESAFESCHLESVMILDGVSVIGSSAFANNWGLNTVSIPDTVTCIEESAFLNCNIESLKLSDNLISIGDCAFAYNNISNVLIPDKVTYLGIVAFDFGNTNIEIAEGNTAYCSKGNCIIEIAAKKLVFANAKSVIPDDGSVLIIGECAYQTAPTKNPKTPGFNNINIIIPEGITEICENAFMLCGTDITDITIPVSVKKIGANLYNPSIIGRYITFHYLGTCAQWNEVSGGEYSVPEITCSDGKVKNDKYDDNSEHPLIKYK